MGDKPFRSLGARLLQDAFPDLGPEAVDRYLRRAEQRTPRPAETVLLIDDEDDLRDIMRRMLERRGFQTLLAADAVEALQICRAHVDVVDFVVADVGLSVVADHEFASALADAQPHARMVLFSGLSREPALDKGLDAIVVRKPFSAETLVEALREASDRVT